MKKVTLVALLLVLILALASCKPSNIDDVPTGVNPQDVLGSAPQVENTPDGGGTGGEGDLGDAAMNEEGVNIPDDQGEEEPVLDLQDFTNANFGEAAATPYPFTGATPIVLNPIDMPTATPAPEVDFSYMPYNASKLGLTFSGPAGWNVNEDIDNTFILTEPFERDGVVATIIITRENIVDAPTISDLKKLVELEIEQMSQAEFESFQKYGIEERTLLGGDGVYTNYRGTLPGGAVVRGRYHVVVIGNVRYTVHLRHAANFNEDYLKNYAELRRSIQASS